MNTIDTSQLLTQLRAAAAAAQSQAVPTQETGADAKFSSLLTQSINQVNSLQQETSGLREAFQVGDPNVTLPQVMIAGAKSSLAFQTMVQTRNKMVEAYQEIMRMQV